MASTNEDDWKPTFDESFAKALIGKYVLVGITTEDKRGEFKRQEQFHGTVESANEREGVRLSLRGLREGETKILPPATDVFEKADKGTYQLRSTGEQVVDPDFICTWLVKEPDA
jgi:hypothetical protein